MKLNVSRDSLLTAIQLVARVASTRSTLPALSGILMSITDDEAVLRATDTELGVSRPVDGARIEGEGTVLMPGRLVADVARNLPEGDVSIEHRAEHSDVELTAGGARFHLRTLPAEDFPRLPELEGEAVRLPGPALAETIERVARAASRDEVRPILTGILLQAEGSRLTMVATDSYRLSVKHADLESALDQPLDANVPARAFRELARVITTESVEEVEIALSRNQIVFRAGAVLLSSRLIEGQFPSWRQLIPESFDHEVRLPRRELLDVTRRVGQLAQRNAPLRLAFAEGELTVAAETPDVGDASETLPAPFSGEPMEIAFNPQFLIDGIDSVDADEIAIQLSSPLRPGLLTPVGRDDFSYLAMPIRLNV
jgi:DNA polymerase-3 subunit beta